MQKMNIEAFKLIGISVRTTNQNNQAAKDIGALWGRFMDEQIQSKIPNKTSMDILSIYSDYEGDHNAPYTTFLGCKVATLDEIPEGMIGKEFAKATCVKFVSKGDLTQGAVYKTWSEIWATPLNRKYAHDFEVYGEKAQNPKDAEVDIFVSINS